MDMETTAVRPRRWLRIATRLILAALSLFVFAYVGISILAANILTRPRNQPNRIDPLLVSARAEPWSVKTGDGLTLRGWYCPTARHRQLVVLVHGKGGFWSEMAAIGRDLNRAGYDVLLFDLRGHGQSDPARLSMGRRERVDLRAVLAWGERQGFPADRIGWLGQSMGASALVMEAAGNPRIRVAVLDSPFGHLPELLDDQLPRYSHLPRWFNPGILTAARYVYGIRTDDLVPIRSARAWGGRPLLLIHGEADTIVPLDQAVRLARAAGPSCQTVTLPGVDHVQAYDNDPRRYVAAVDSFFQRNLSP